MPKSPNQKQRILQLERIFLEETDEKHPLSLKQLQNRLARADIQVERKTLYDDFDCLDQMGIKINRENKRYYTQSRPFTDAELKLLIDAVSSSRFLTEEKSRDLVKKLTRLASHGSAEALNRQVILTGRVSVMNEKALSNIDALHSAMRENVSVTFKYFDWNEKKEQVQKNNGELYHVSPWAMLRDDEKYYLLGYNEPIGRIYTYRVDKMEDVKKTDQKRNGSEMYRNQHVENYRTNLFGMFSGRQERVTFRVKNYLAGVIIDRFGSDSPFYQHGDFFETSASVQISPLFYGWVCSFGGDISIVNPPEIREEFRTYLSSLTAAHPETPDTDPTTPA